VLQTCRETRRRFYDHPPLRIEGAAARGRRNCRTPGALTPHLQIVLTLRGGVSSARYQRRLRLSRALIGLPHTDDIAALELGFPSHAHFSNAFRATYGEMPFMYRLRLAAG